MTKRYPSYPGAKGIYLTRHTSEAAAKAIAPNVTLLRLAALSALSILGEATVLECVAYTAHSRESLQPRFSELSQQGLIEPTGKRRLNPSGRSATVWRLTPAATATNLNSGQRCTDG